VDENKGEKTEMELKLMNKYQKFRYAFPFYRMDVNGFMKLVNDARRIVEPNMETPLYEVKFVTLSSLQEAFKENAMWSAELKDDETKLVKLLNATCIYEHGSTDLAVDQEATCYDIRFLRGWAILWCDGNAKEKVPELYDMLQDNNQPTISAGDKDFNVTMTFLFDCAGYTIDRNYNIISDEELKPELTEEELEAKAEKYDEIFEQFLDTVFGEYESVLDREDWEKNTASKAKYVFDPEEIRKKIEWK